MWRVWVRRGECIGSCWGKPEGKRPLGRPRRRWVDNIRMDLQEVSRLVFDIRIFSKYVTHDVEEVKAAGA